MVLYGKDGIAIIHVDRDDAFISSLLVSLHSVLQSPPATPVPPCSVVERESVNAGRLLVSRKWSREVANGTDTMCNVSKSASTSVTVWH